MASIPSEVLVAYGFNPENVAAQSFGTGLINHTWKIETTDAVYILQTINQHVFPNPPAIASNIDAVGDYLQQYASDYYFVRPVKTLDGNSMVFSEGQYFRLFPFVKGSHAKTVVGNASEAFEAAKQFGNFTRLLSGFETSSLLVTLSDFHNLTLRYKQFEEALLNGNQDRIEASQQIIKELQEHSDIVNTYQSILLNPDFKQR